MTNFHIDENAMMELVCATHNPDGTNFNSNVVLSAIEKILNSEKATDKEATGEMLEEFELNFREFSLKIQHLCFELTSKSSSMIDGHLTTICLLSTLSAYPWEAKMVLMLAAFSICNGKLNIFSQLHYRKGLREQLPIVMQMTNSTTSNDPNPIDDLIKCAMDLTKCIVEINQSSSDSLSQSVILALPMASYWIGRSIACIATNCACLPLTNIKFRSELNIITAKIKDTLSTCFPALEAKKAEESYKALKRALFHNSSDKLEVLKLIFNVIDGNEISLSTRQTPEVEKIGLNFFDEDKKVALLLTSGLDISNERIQILNNFYTNSISTPYILWIPIVDDHFSWSTKQHKEFRDKMEFEIMDDPHKRIARSFTRFVKENLLPHFQIGEEPILISLDQQGRIIHKNAMHMIQTWSPGYIEDRKLEVQERNNIFPFIEKEMKERSQGLDSLIFDIDEQISHLAGEVDEKINAWTSQINNMINKLRKQSNMYSTERENALWKKEKDWSLGLVVGEIDYRITSWIREGCYIFLYGGNDIKWVREFTSKVHEVRFKTDTAIMLIYMGKNETIRASIDEENMSHLLHSSYHSWRFWTRLRSALLSRINYLYATNCHGDVCDDEIAQGFKKLLGYECKGAIMEGWALLSKGQKVVVCGQGAKMLRVINEHESWKENVALKSFDQAFKDYYNKTLHTSCSSNSHSCCAFEYPVTLKDIPMKEKCPECFRDMQKMVTFTCHHGDN
ncbi:PREDICTED: protein SIEVE ELEMENT OCCLUSION B-like [Ipomoea nil]|uniref:protein SIEVE ELEMENT OCCLUSION B-like n=1 Tax=Ipomoea nil TaxID=35883 RepID=UPI000900A713|nr:PREDICTED: protein SIEVE ELEMENT OCCLUSION B-like [Ipomoea nil]